MNKDTIHDLQMLVWNSSNAFADMRLMVEGAITLYEDDAESICSLTLDQTDKHAAIVYDTIGTALYGLRGEDPGYADGVHDVLCQAAHATC